MEVKCDGVDQNVVLTLVFVRGCSEDAWKEAGHGGLRNRCAARPYEHELHHMRCVNMPLLLSTRRMLCAEGNNNLNPSRQCMRRRCCDQRLHFWLCSCECVLITQALRFTIAKLDCALYVPSYTMCFDRS